MKPRLYPWLQFTKWVYSDILIISKVTALSNNFAPLTKDRSSRAVFHFQNSSKPFQNHFKTNKKRNCRSSPLYPFLVLKCRFLQIFCKLKPFLSIFDHYSHRCRSVCGDNCVIIADRCGDDRSPRLRSRKNYRPRHTERQSFCYRPCSRLTAKSL